MIVTAGRASLHLTGDQACRIQLSLQRSEHATQRFR